MSTPERQQDPGEHGYGSTGQEAPGGDEHEPFALPPFVFAEQDRRLPPQRDARSAVRCAIGSQMIGGGTGSGSSGGVGSGCGSGSGPGIGEGGPGVSVVTPAVSPPWRVCKPTPSPPSKPFAPPPLVLACSGMSPDGTKRLRRRGRGSVNRLPVGLVSLDVLSRDKAASRAVRPHGREPCPPPALHDAVVEEEDLRPVGRPNRIRLPS